MKNKKKIVVNTGGNRIYVSIVLVSIIYCDAFVTCSACFMQKSRDVDCDSANI